MFLGEVAGKRVVVQGLWIGGWCWGPEMPHGGEAGERRKKVRDESIRTAGKGEMGAAYPRAGSASHAGMNETTPAPWARPTSVSDSRAAILDATRATWASPPPRR
jgi:serine/threonine-protein phosphatase 2A activator